MSRKIDVRNILSAHIQSLVDGEGKWPGFWDWIIFLVIPIIVAWALVGLGAYMTEGILGTVVSAFSIFVGLLLNVMVLLFDIVRNTQRQPIKHKIVKQTLANVSFATLLSLLTILVSLTTQITRWPGLKPYTTFVTYVLAFGFIATLLMIVKRLYTLFLDEAKVIQNPPPPPAADEWIGMDGSTSTLHE